MTMDDPAHEHSANSFDEMVDVTNRALIIAEQAQQMTREQQAISVELTAQRNEVTSALLFLVEHGASLLYVPQRAALRIDLDLIPNGQDGGLERELQMVEIMSKVLGVRYGHVVSVCTGISNTISPHHEQDADD